MGGKQVIGLAIAKHVFQLHTVDMSTGEIADYLGWYNTQRPHSSLERFTPQEK